MLRFPLMENKGVLHLNLFGMARRKTIKNKIIGGYYENQKISEKARVKQKYHRSLEL
jgi:hypothetical protein